MSRRWEPITMICKDCLHILPLSEFTLLTRKKKNGTDYLYRRKDCHKCRARKYKEKIFSAVHAEWPNLWKSTKTI